MTRRGGGVVVDGERKAGGLDKSRRDLAIAAAVMGGLMLLLFGLAVGLTVRSGGWRGLAWFLNGDARFTLRAFLLGLIPGAVFGFVDQLALWVRILTDEPVTLSTALGQVLLPVLPDGKLVKSGWANTLSDTISTFCAVMVAKIVAVTSGVDSTPLYSEVLGVFLGCLAGIYVPRLITGRA